MANKRPSVMAAGLLAPKGKAPARSTAIEDLPRASSTPSEAAGEKPRNIKTATVGTTVYLIPGEAIRLKRLALDMGGVSVHDMILDGLDRILAEANQPPLQRYSAPKTRKKV